MPCANASATDNAGVTPYGTLQPVAAPSARKTISLRKIHSQDEKITMLTAYDATLCRRGRRCWR